MKKVLFFLAAVVAATTISAADYYYNCGITEVSVDTLASTTKNQFTVTFKQKCKNKAEYTSKPETFYTSTVKLVLNSDDRTLEGVYTTEGASPTSSSSNVNDQTINLVTSEFTSGSTSRVLRSDVISTFTIEKIDDTHYSISDGTLYFTQRVNKTSNWTYYYSYDADEILTEGIDKTPFVFGYDPEFHTEFIDYDMKVTALTVYRENSDYDAIRYFLVLTCEGTNRTTSVTHDYEVALAIYPTAESIVGTFATRETGTVLMAVDSYVKDQTINKTRYLANDSLSTIQIKDKGSKQYSFYGGTLICADPDANYLAVYGKKRIEAAHYYHFSDNDGAGIEFKFDEDSGESGLITTAIDALVGQQPLHKIMYNGVLYIERNGRLYNLQGSVVR